MDNLPLIPGKGSMCGDVKPVLREVFRELSHLPPLATGLAMDHESPPPPPPTRPSAGATGDGDQPPPAVNQWVENYSKECKEIWQREDELKQQHAKRISKEPQPNLFKLYPSSPETAPAQRCDPAAAFIQRRDLLPTIQQNAGRDATLWVKNILNRSSCDVTTAGEELRVHSAIRIQTADEFTMQSLSIGEIVSRPPVAPPPAPPAPPEPEYIVCVPPELEFINFSIGQSYAKTVRLVNVSKWEVRVSVRPPARRELCVELAARRGLAVSAGAAAALRVHFRPRDVRALRDALLVRVSRGRALRVPVACYMQPPVLDILVPSVSWPVPRCSAGEGSEGSEGGEGGAGGAGCGHDVLELGARLLGDVHCARLVLRCDAPHAAFFLLTEDAWLSYTIDCVRPVDGGGGAVVCGPFSVRPAWWSGGGGSGGGSVVAAAAWCRAARAGLHAAPLRVLCSTAVTRPLHLLADCLHWRPEHITIRAHDRDYDICSEDDPACEYYVHLGAALPGRALAATVQLVNHSPIVYTYYWNIRPWGVCSCWEEAPGSPEEDDQLLCVGAKESKATGGETNRAARESAGLVRVEAACGQLPARAATALHVRVPDAGAGAAPTTRRAVLMLVLKDIPKESFAPDVDPMIISTEEVEAEIIPGMPTYRREVCDVVCAQMEVWWEVAPVRFALSPPVLPLNYSRRLQSLDIQLHSALLYGSEAVQVCWETPAHIETPPPAALTPAQTCTTKLTLQLPSQPDDYPDVDVITVRALTDAWSSRCEVHRACATRHPALRPAISWLGVVPPGTRMHTTLEVVNNTYQHVYWSCVAHRWRDERVPRAACAGRARAACAHCRQRACSCAILRPAAGALAHLHNEHICYDVNAPDTDGCVATLVQVRRTRPDMALAGAAGAGDGRGAGVEARAALVAYRVLAPRLLLRAMPCFGDKKHECGGCSLDGGARASRLGAACLRPLGALPLARRSCYRLRVTNLTPIATAVHWEPPPDGDDVLKVTFIPNDFSIRSYGVMEIRVVLEARAVCARRVFVRRGRVLRAYRPLYLVIDAAIAGLEVTCEVPLGDGDKADSFVIVRNTQSEEYPWETNKRKPTTAEEIFTDDDHKRQLVAENICRCPFELQYIPPVPEVPRNPAGTPDIEIVTEPPSLTRVCACFKCTKPVMPEIVEPICLQFRNIPLRTVRTRTITLRNESVLTAHWSVAPRRWPRIHTRTIAPDQWAGDVRAPGLCVQCAPARGVLGARAAAGLRVLVYADCWGLYCDQILLQIENLEPIIIDIWVEAVGPPLQFALRPTDTYRNEAPTLWMSGTDPARLLRARNTSRGRLEVHAYVLEEHEHPQDALPFRLYLRFFDVTPRACPCATAFDSDELADESGSHAPPPVSAYSEEMDTGLEVYLAPDHGVQNDNIYEVSPGACTMEAGECAQWRVLVTSRARRAPHARLLLRLLPLDCSGPHWFRPEPPPLHVQLRQTERQGLLQASCRRVCVQLCALALPVGDVMRIRKRFRIVNVGTGGLAVSAATGEPWSVLADAAPRAFCGAGCACDRRPAARRLSQLAWSLEPRSSHEVCVEASVRAVSAWPAAGSGGSAQVQQAACPPPRYEPRVRTVTPLHFYDDDNVLLTIPLILELEYPVVQVEPSTVDFGFVTDGDTRKTYFSVSHTSDTLTLELMTEWQGPDEFQIWPRFLSIPPRISKLVYVQYTAVWRAAPAEGCARVHACGAAGAWCRAAVACRAAPARDHTCRAAPHDHTDDARLLPRAPR